MKYNMNFFDIALRYTAMMIIVIIGGILHSIPVMLLGVPFFLSGILGWCPTFQMLGIDHGVQCWELDEK